MKIQFLTDIGVDYFSGLDGQLESKSYRKYDQVEVLDVQKRQHFYSDIKLTNGATIFVDNTDFKVIK